MEILKIRLFQFRRIITDLGLFRTLFLMIVGAAVIFPLFALTNDKDGALIVAGITLIAIYSLHTKRKDLHFLKVNVDKYVNLLFIEYCILSAPVIIGLLYHGFAQTLKFLIATILVASLYTIAKFLNSSINKSPHLPISLSLPLRFPLSLPLRFPLSPPLRFPLSPPLRFPLSPHLPLSKPFPFEWISGIRTYFWWLSGILLIALAGSFWIGTIPVCMIFYSLITLSFNEKNEPLNLVLVYEKSPAAFLAQKIKNHLILYSLPLVPLMVLFMIFHYQYWYLVILTYLILAAVQAYSVLAKYSFYVPNTRSGGQPFNILGALSVFLPFLLPLILLLSIRFYIRSVSNLNQYLDDYN